MILSVLQHHPFEPLYYNIIPLNLCTTGTDVAIDAASIVLMRSKLGDVLVAFDLSRACYNRIIMNFVWAYGYNLVRGEGRVLRVEVWG